MFVKFPQLAVIINGGAMIRALRMCTNRYFHEDAVDAETLDSGLSGYIRLSQVILEQDMTNLEKHLYGAPDEKG